MRYVALSEIVIPENRQRREFDERRLEELANSIADKGLFNPISLRDDGRTLVSGERRLRAISRLYESGRVFNCDGAPVPAGAVPHSVLSELDAYRLREAELEENTIRVDLTWHERAAAVAELHALRGEQRAARGEVQTLTDTASELLGRVAIGSQITDVGKMLKINQFLDDPEVKAAPTQAEALKIIKRKVQADHRRVLAESAMTVSTRHELLLGDVSYYVHKLPYAAFNMLIADPPYGVEANTFGEQAAATHEYDDTLENAIKCYLLAFHAAENLCGPNASALMFCDIRHFSDLYHMWSTLTPTWTIWQTPLIWAKAGGMLPVPERGPRRTYEAIIYGYRGNRGWNTIGTPDVIECPGLQRPVFGAQKPRELFIDLFSRISMPGDRILDLYAGTCPTIPAADKFHCKVTAVEQSADKLNYAKVEYLCESS